MKSFHQCCSFADSQHALRMAQLRLWSSMLKWLNRPRTFSSGRKMSLVRVPPPRPNLWCCANFPPPEVFIRGIDGKQQCRTSKRTCRQNEQDTYDDIFGSSALALTGRRHCKIEANDTKARIFGECEVGAPDEFCLPVLTNFTCRNPIMNPCTWEQYLRKPCLNRTPLGLRQMLENEEGASNGNCNGCPKLPPICPHRTSCPHPVDQGRQCGNTVCLQCLPVSSYSLADATHCNCFKNNHGDICWLGDPKETQCSCSRVCGQTCMGRHALDLVEAKCPPIELPNQLYWLGNPVCGVTTVLQRRACGSTMPSVESWPFGGFSKQPCRNLIDSNFIRSPKDCSTTNTSLSSKDYDEPRKNPVGTSRTSQNRTDQNKTDQNKTDSDNKVTTTSNHKSSVSTLSRTSKREPSQSKTTINQSKSVMINAPSSECDYPQPNCPNENNECWMFSGREQRFWNSSN